MTLVSFLGKTLAGDLVPVAFRQTETIETLLVGPKANAQSVRSVVRTLQILECLAEERREVGVSEVARRTQLGVATCHRLLGTLCNAGYVAQSSQSGRYLLGYRTVAIASNLPLLADNLLLAHAGDILSELTKAFGETPNLAVRDGVHARFVTQVPSRAAVRMVTVIGERVPLHPSAIGKAIIAHSDSQVLERQADALPIGRERSLMSTISDSQEDSQAGG